MARRRNRAQVSSGADIRDIPDGRHNAKAKRYASRASEIWIFPETSLHANPIGPVSLSAAGPSHVRRRNRLKFVRFFGSACLRRSVAEASV
jgi:hypothetical protein